MHFMLRLRWNYSSTPYLTSNYGWSWDTGKQWHPVVYMKIITYPCPNPDAALAKLCQEREPLGSKIKRHLATRWYFAVNISCFLVTYSWRGQMCSIRHTQPHTTEIFFTIVGLSYTGELSIRIRSRFIKHIQHVYQTTKVIYSYLAPNVVGLFFF